MSLLLVALGGVAGVGCKTKPQHHDTIPPMIPEDTRPPTDEPPMDEAPPVDEAPADDAPMPAPG